MIKSKDNLMLYTPHYKAVQLLGLSMWEKFRDRRSSTHPRAKIIKVGKR